MSQKCNTIRRTRLELTDGSSQTIEAGVEVIVLDPGPAFSVVAVPSVDKQGVMATSAFVCRAVDPILTSRASVGFERTTPPPPPDPAASAALPASFKGHGTFIYDLAETTARHGTLAKLVKAMTDCGMTHAWLRVHGRSRPSGDQTKNKAAISALKAAGISVAAWGWCQGENIAAEAKLAIDTTAALGLTEYVADIEHGHNDSDWTENEISDFLSTVRAGLPGCSLALSTFCLIDWHKPSLMRAAAPLIDAFAPQVYWFFYPSKRMRNEFGARYAPENPAAYADLCLDRWREITNKPLILTGQAYWGEAEHWVQDEAEIKLESFLSEFQGWKRVAGVNWWHFGGSKAMSPKMLDLIKAANIAARL